MANRLQKLNRTAGNVEPQKSYNNKTDINQMAENIKKREEVKKEKNSKKSNNQKATIKVSSEIKAKMEAQKQIEGIKFDYELIDILLERNLENYSARDKNKYEILLDIK